MQVEEINAQGLKREYQVTLPSNEFNSRVDEQLHALKTTAQIKGFRPGKVPLTHLRKLHGARVMYDVLNEMISSANQNILETRGFTLASRPEVDFDEEGDHFEKNRLDGKDIAYRIRFEVMPEVQLQSLNDASFERYVVELKDADIDETLLLMSERSFVGEPRAEGEAAQDGDFVTFDLIVAPQDKNQEPWTEDGRKIFLNASQNKDAIKLSNLLKGMKVGEEKDVQNTQAGTFSTRVKKGQEVSYKLKVTNIEIMNRESTISSILERVGVETEEALRDFARQQLTDAYASEARLYLKRALFDKLNEIYVFDAPSVLEDQEFERVWQQRTAMAERGESDPQEAGKDEDTLRREYRAIANRRVRLAIVLGAVGREHNISISEEELKAGIMRHISSYATSPEMAKFLWKYFTEDQNFVKETHARLLEEKTTDHIVNTLSVTDVPINVEKFDEMQEAQADSLSEDVHGVALQGEDA